ncbi:MAG: anhydro-N-acetylmuramic acid kinase [Hyphomicrobiales bacterium]|nr:MAG: anhydro-N-acetylmuramic acid kinase [Hyphomicrobiales bacterium]
MPTFRAIGLMSGTSMDGVDVALIETDGEEITTFGPASFQPYDESDRAMLREALDRATKLTDRNDRPAPLDEAEQLVTECHRRAVEAFLAEHGVARRTVDIIGFHGQTVFHDPARGLTVQLGCGKALAHALGIPVVYDLRYADVAAGGEGAPLAPVYHGALAKKAGDVPAVFLNVGGVANVTFIAEDGALLAFDTGPGNALIDDWMLRHSGAARDENGETARSGAPIATKTLKALMADPYFELAPPKSLDRNHFDIAALDGLSVADGARTLVDFTVESIAAASRHFPQEPKRWVVCGGGRHNAFLMERLGERIAEPVVAAEELGFDGDAIEAQAFAFMAVRRLLMMPISYPGTTGVSEPLTGGIIAQP